MIKSRDLCMLLVSVQRLRGMKLCMRNTQFLNAIKKILNAILVRDHLHKYMQVFDCSCTVSYKI